MAHGAYSSSAGIAGINNEVSISLEGVNNFTG